MTTRVERLHRDGQKYYSYPYRLYILENTADMPDCTVISVPKKIFKRAVKRNLVRRRTREALRLLRSEFPFLDGKDVLMVYIAKEILEYGKIVEGLRTVLAKVPQDNA